MNDSPAGHAYNLHLGQPDMHISNISAVTIDNIVLTMVRLRPLFAQAIDEWVREYCQQNQITNIGSPRILDLHPSNNEAGEMRVYYAFVNWGSAERNQIAMAAMHTQEFLNTHIRVQYERRPPIVRFARPVVGFSRHQGPAAAPQQATRTTIVPAPAIQARTVQMEPILVRNNQRRQEVEVDDGVTVVGVANITACTRCGREDVEEHRANCMERKRAFAAAQQQQIEQVRIATCATCLSHFWQTHPAEIMTLVCGHLHHRKCIERHMGNAQNEACELCPGCRRPIEEFVRYLSWGKI